MADTRDSDSRPQATCEGSIQRAQPPRRRAKGGLPGGITGGNTGNLMPPWKTGQSGNWAGRPGGDARIRRLMTKTLAMCEKEAIEALCRRWKNTKHVQDMVELLAKLGGELNKDTGEAGRGVQLLILNNLGEHPLDPETFRQSVQRRVLEDQRRQGISAAEWGRGGDA